MSVKCLFCSENLLCTGAFWQNSNGADSGRPSARGRLGLSLILVVYRASHALWVVLFNRIG